MMRKTFPLAFFQTWTTLVSFLAILFFSQTVAAQYPNYPEERFRIRLNQSTDTVKVGEPVLLNYEILYDKDIYYPHLVEDTVPGLDGFWIEEAPRDLLSTEIVHLDSHSYRSIPLFYLHAYPLQAGPHKLPAMELTFAIFARSQGERRITDILLDKSWEDISIPRLRVTFPEAGIYVQEELADSMPVNVRRAHQ